MKAAFCGSFDPVTIGHMDLIERSSRLYEQVIVFISANPAKKDLFTAQRRAKWIAQACKDAGLDNVEVAVQGGVSVEACKKAGCSVMIRGVRNETDMAYEANLAYMNSQLDPTIETVYLFTRPAYAYISSSNVRELYALGRSLKGFVPECVISDLQPDIHQA